MSIEFKPFRIGAVEIASPVVLAALAGYSDLAYRRVCRSLGAPYCATEMMLDQSLLVSGKLRKRMLRLTDDDHPVAGQLIGREPRAMAEAAGMLVDGGFDVVDLNFACPARKALRRGRGGAIMRQTDQARAIVEAVLAAVDVPVTVKLRSAFSASDGDHEAFWTIAEHALGAGVSAICVHGRAVGERYLGQADWPFLAEIKRHFPEGVIIGSGDIREPRDALRMLNETRVDAVAAARGAMGNPWFFGQVADLVAGREAQRPSLAEQRRVLAWQFELACELYGQQRAAKMMRKFGIKYASACRGAKRIRSAFVRVESLDDWRAVLDEFYPADEADSPDVTAAENTDPGATATE